MAEAVEMPFVFRTRVGPRNHVLDEAHIPPMGRGNCEGERQTVVKYTDTLQSSVQKRLNRLSCHLGGELRWAKELCVR